MSNKFCYACLLLLGLMVALPQMSFAFGKAGSTMSFNINGEHFNCIPLEKDYPVEPWRFTGVSASIDKSGHKIGIACSIYNNGKRGPDLKITMPDTPGEYVVAADAKQKWELNSYHKTKIYLSSPPESINRPGDDAYNGFISTSNQRSDIASGDSRGKFSVKYHFEGDKVVGTFSSTLHVFDQQYNKKKKYGSPPKYLQRDGVKITNGRFSVHLSL